MKRAFFYLLTLLSICNATNAQSGWVTTKFNADELKGTNAYFAQSYTDKTGNSLTIWSDEDDYFRILSGSHIFDYTVTYSLKEVIAIVGFYDKNDNFIEKIQMTFLPEDDNPRIAHNSVFLATNRKKGKKVIQYLKNEFGYIRIVAPLYGSTSGFDMKIPCLKTADDAQREKTQSIYETIYKGIKDGILKKVSISGLSDSVSISNYKKSVEVWVQNHQQQMSLTKVIDSTNQNHIVIHVRQPIAPDLVVIQRKQGSAKLLYDIVIDIDSINHTGEWCLNNIIYKFSIHENMDNTLTLSQLEEIKIELDVILELCAGSGIGSAFYINDHFLERAKEAQVNTHKIGKYLSLYGGLLLTHSSILLDFPWRANRSY